MVYGIALACWASMSPPQTPAKPRTLRLPRFTADKTATVASPSMVPPIDASSQSPRDKTA